MTRSISSGRSFSCFIIGETSLPIRCAEFLLEEGHQIKGIITPDATLSKWGLSKGIPVHDSSAGLAEILTREGQFDYLFSIFNSLIIPEAVLSLPARFAVNCHDGPLPRYAGMNAASWALLRGEHSHAVTWHVMTKGIDDGDVLVQRHFEMADDATSFSMNIKCYEAAAVSFRELVDGLSTGQIIPAPQDLSKRTLTARSDRPENGAIVSWNRPAAELHRRFRGLNFGSYPNPLGLPLMLAKGELFVLAGCSVEERKGATATPAASPGTIRFVGDCLKVATADGDLVVEQVATLRGEPLAIGDWAARCHLRPGGKMESLEDGAGAVLSQTHRQVARHEEFWVTRLAQTGLTILPWPAPASAPGQAADWENVPLAMTLPSGLADMDPAVAAVSALVCYLGRFQAGGAVDLAVSLPEVRQIGERLGPVAGQFFASHTPLRIAAGRDWTFEQTAAAVATELATCRKRLTHTADIFLRYPELRDERCEPSLIVHCEAGRFPSLCYDRRRVDGEHLRRAMGHWQTLLEWAAEAQPGTPANSLEILSGQEHRRVVKEWSGSEKDLGELRPLHCLFEGQAARGPDRPALLFEQRQVSYGELNERANRLARCLQDHGIGLESPVALVMDRSIDFIVTLLAVLKAGGAFVPINKSHPPARVAYMLENSGATVVITQRSLLEKLPPFAGAQLVVEDLETGSYPAHNLDVAVTARNLLCILYTSGSSGKPKGVLLEHGPILTHFLVRPAELFPITEADTCMHFSSIGFDMMVDEVFSALMIGARLVIVPPGYEVDARYLWSLIAREGIAWIQTTPSVLSLLLHAAPAQPPTCVRLASVGGEALTRELRRKHAALLPGASLVNGYGPTETSIEVSFEPAPAEMEKVTIGKPVANTRLYLLDAAGKPVPEGVTGMLHIGGAQLARGYVNNPALTAERFIEHPQLGRLYNSGDLGRWLPEGTIEFLGRADSQVKLRGLRIELGEIASALAEVPSISEAAVIVRKRREGDARLVAYVVLAEGAGGCGGGGDIAAWQKHLRQGLPEYMVPGCFVMLDCLPVTSNGKLDESALPEPPANPTSVQVIGPRNPTEEKLAALWREAVGRDHVEIDDDYFALGGDSLGAARLVVAIERQFGVAIPLVAFVKSPTVARMAQYIARGGRSNHHGEDESGMVVVLRQGSHARPPLILIHTLFGELLGYRDLLNHLPADQPVFGIQAASGAGGVSPEPLEAMARRYRAAIDQSCPAGPIHLAGHSMGGFVAYEMAQQWLEAREGRTVAGLFVIDAEIMVRQAGSGGVVQTLEYQGQRLRSLRTSLGGLGLVDQARYVVGRVVARFKKRMERRQVKIRLEQAREEEKLYERKVRESGSEALRQRAVVFRSMVDRYAPRKYQGDVVVLLAEHTYHPVMKKWWAGNVHGRADLHMVPGNHLDMLQEPHVRAIASHIKDRLESAS